MQHAASHTTAVQPSSHNQRHVLIGKQWHQLPELLHCIDIVDKFCYLGNMLSADGDADAAVEARI